MLTSTLTGLIILLSIVSLTIGQSSSFDSLVSSQCRARCLALYPWKTTLNESPQFLRYFQKRDLSSSINHFSPRNVIRHTNRHNRNQRGHGKWNRVLKMCSENSNCLQCTLPCDMPSNLLANCKYLCKDNNQLCLDSCALLTRANKEKRGECPSLVIEPVNTIQLLISSKGSLAESNAVLNRCSQDSKTRALKAIALNNQEESSQQCTQDNECSGVSKCCQLQSSCPQHGSVCAKPIITVDRQISPPPFNLSIVERKSGKTIILKWDSTYIRNKPTLFVVEGRWSLQSPTSQTTDNRMTKWGYLAQTINNNWIILRNINRGRWYKFRVASITKSGTQGYSKPTEMFILSSAPKPPSQPQNLTVKIMQGASLVQAQLGWLPSRRSDLPIVKYKLTWRQESSNSPHYGYDFIASNVNKYTIPKLLSNTIYSVELTAISLYDNKELTSKPQRLQINTANSITSHASLLSSEPSYDDDAEDQNVDLLTPRIIQDQISNLTVKNAYFRNGLVKAKIAWSNKHHESINSINQQMFTITWFAITCTDTTSNLPTPITATTISTSFEIYELKYNCNYVVNVRLATKSNRGSSSLNPAPPQVASAQFKVPSCNSVNIIGHIRPRCYLHNNQKSPTPSNKHLTTTKRPLIITTTPLKLPRVYNIRHRIVTHKSDLYSVEFTWSLNKHFHQQGQFNGYQISVVPKAIPGFGTSSSENIGSVGAIVEKTENSFVVKQLHASVKYIFQIQLIALDNQSYGPASSLEFKINAIDFSRTTLSNRYYSVNNRVNQVTLPSNLESSSTRLSATLFSIVVLQVLLRLFL